MPGVTVATSILRSPWPAPEVPEVGLAEFVLRRAGELGDKPALIDAPSGRTVTYRQLADSVRRAAAGLAARGFNEGDVLALHAPNLPEYAVVALAVAARGGAVTTANPLYTADELARQLTDSGASLLVTVPPFLDTARAAAQSAGVDDVIVLGTAPEATSFASTPRIGRCRPPRPRTLIPTALWRCSTRAVPPACPRASSSRTAR